MSLDNLFPSAGDNAIQSAIFAVEWPFGAPSKGELPIEKIRDAVKNALGEEFTHSDDMSEFTMSVGPQGVTHAASHHSVITGFVLQKRSNDGGVKRSITVFPDKVLIQINDYTRWNGVVADIRRYFSVLTEHFWKNKPIAAIGLQFSDVFSWKSNPEELDLSEVFRGECRMLPPNILELKSLWHSHHGYITAKNKPMPGEQLDNVNISRIIQDGVHAIQMVCAHRFSFVDSFFVNDLKKIEEILSVYDALHLDNKSVFGNVFSDGVLSKLKDFSGVHK